MKRKLQIIISASAASVLAVAALAQEPFTRTNDAPTYSPGRMSHARRIDRLNEAAKASELIGMTVKNYQNEKLGKVKEIAVDVESGRVIQVILSTGGFLEIGDTLTAVPPGALHHDVTNQVIHLDADKAKLKGAPVFDMSKWDEYSDSDHLRGVYGYYGEGPASKLTQNGEATVPEDQRNTNAVFGTLSALAADAPRDPARLPAKTHSMIPASRPDQVQKASKLLGTAVKNLQDEKLGKVENLLVDLASGRVVAIIISSGGFLGMDNELSAVPPTALRFNTDRDTLQLDASKKQLSSAPHFKANQWPDLGQPSYAVGVYRAYKVEPYFTTNEATEVDNTASNVRDRNDATLTPLDQGNSQADVNTTAQIRKEIIAGKGMSMNAKNVKIITNNGQVTLRGPVNSAEEKRLIGVIADRIAHAENVDNQLEVRLTTSSNN